MIVGTAIALYLTQVFDFTKIVGESGVKSVLTRTNRCGEQYHSVLRQGLAAALLCVVSITAQAAQYHKLEDIRLSSENFLRTQLGVTSDDENTQVKAASMDYRLRLAQCDTELKHSLPQGHRLQGRVAVGARCMDGNHRWSIFVPVTITQFADVLVTTEIVSRGEFLRADQLKLERRSLTVLHNGYLKSFKQAVGKQLKTTLAKGLVVKPNQLKRPYTIKQGQNVNLLAKSDLISVRIKGKALSNARVGDRIRVKNTSTNKIVEGTVTYNGFVEIKL